MAQVSPSIKWQKQPGRTCLRPLVKFFAYRWRVFLVAIGKCVFSKWRLEIPVFMSCEFKDMWEWNFMLMSDIRS